MSSEESFYSAAFSYSSDHTDFCWDVFFVCQMSSPLSAVVVTGTSSVPVMLAHAALVVRISVLSRFVVVGHRAADSRAFNCCCCSAQGGAAKTVS